MRTLVIGDIHGAYRALRSVLDKAGFDFDRDRLIVLGDIADGWPEVKECVDLLLSIKHKVVLRGNHDAWLLDWMQTGEAPELWLEQGGEASRKAYGERLPLTHQKFFEATDFYYQYQNDLFVHAGINVNVSLADQTEFDLLWSRTLVYDAHIQNDLKNDVCFGSYQTIWVGHTPTTKFLSHVPLRLCNVQMMDTGAGWGASLSIMDMNTGQYWQSKPVQELYPDFSGRGQ